MVVSEEEARKLANSWGVNYVETSAKARVNVDKVYYDLMCDIRDQKRNNQRSENGWGGKKKKKKKKKCSIL